MQRITEEVRLPWMLRVCMWIRKQARMANHGRVWFAHSLSRSVKAKDIAVYNYVAKKCVQ